MTISEEDSFYYNLLFSGLVTIGAVIGYFNGAFKKTTEETKEKVKTICILEFISPGVFHLLFFLKKCYNKTYLEEEVVCKKKINMLGT